MSEAVPLRCGRIESFFRFDAGVPRTNEFLLKLTTALFNKKKFLLTFRTDLKKRSIVCLVTLYKFLNSYPSTKITGSGRKLERTTVWTMVWSWSGQRSVRSEKPDHRRIRANLSLIINGSSAIGSDQKCFSTQLGLIRDHFKRPSIFIFSFFFYLEMLALPRGNKKTDTHLKSDSSDQKKGVQLIVKAGPHQF